MTLIEGVGDEVVQFMAAVLVVMVGAVAWWSTNARPDRYRTVFVMRSRSHRPVTVRIHTRNNVSSRATNTAATAVSEASVNSTESTDTRNVRENARVIPVQEMDSIVDADMAMMDEDRLHFYRRMDTSAAAIQTTPDSTSDEGDVPVETEPASNAQIREMDSIVNAMEADVTTNCEFFNSSSETQNNANKKPINNSNVNNNGADIVNTGTNASGDAAAGTTNVEVENVTPQESSSDSHRIHIKLKYLNETFKEVEGSLDELLKDFKRRHFAPELRGSQRVRLIFRGRVLGDDATLRACGLHDRAVVHCLVHARRAPPPAAGQSQGGAESAGAAAGAEAAVPDRLWDLENILMTVVSIALTVLWFFRCEYSNIFSASASVALFGLTIFYSVAIFGLYMTDAFHFDRRAA